MAARRDGDGDEMREARDALLDLRRAPVPAVAVEGHEPERSGWHMMGPITLSDEEIGRMEGRGQDGQHMRRSARLGGASGAHAPAPVRAPSVASRWPGSLVVRSSRPTTTMTTPLFLLG